MNPINFPEANSTLAQHQKEYVPLRVFRSDDSSGLIISCWSLTWRERLKLLITGKLWHSQLTFWKPAMPILLAVNKPGFPVPPNKL